MSICEACDGFFSSHYRLFRSVPAQLCANCARDFSKMERNYKKVAEIFLLTEEGKTRTLLITQRIHELENYFIGIYEDWLEKRKKKINKKAET